MALLNVEKCFIFGLEKKSGVQGTCSGLVIHKAKCINVFTYVKVWVEIDPGINWLYKKCGSKTTHEVQRGGEISKYSEG